MIGENIKRLRTENGISQDELAKRLNVVRQTVSKWERGISVPDSQLLIPLARELNTTVSELIGEDTLTQGNSTCNTEENNSKAIKIVLKAVFITGIVISSITILDAVADAIRRVMLIMNGGGIIGGVDLPTFIYVTGGGAGVAATVVCLLILMGCIAGLIWLRKKR